MKDILLILMVTPVFAYSQAISSTTAAIENNVPVYEYVPKVIIEGKWGKGPGEFGHAFGGYIGESDTVYKPRSLAVNSKGEIYILDEANNRIEKFEKEGKYIKSIGVEGLSGEIIGYCIDKSEKDDGYCSDLEAPKEGMKYDWPIYGRMYVEGINIVIDSKDRMYYYLKRSSYSVEGGKISETGEVWEFVNDKLTKKWIVPGNLDGALSFYNDSIWITEHPVECIQADFGRDYNVFEKKEYDRNEINMANEKNRNKKGIKIESNQEDKAVIKYGGIKVNIQPEAGERFLSEDGAKKWRIEGSVYINGEEIAIISEKVSDLYINYYDLSGKLLRKHKFPRLKVFSCKDRNGRMFRFDTSENGVKVVMYDWEKSR